MKKIIRNISCIALALLLVSSPFIRADARAYTTEQETQVDEVIKCARRLRGNGSFDGYCQKFIRVCYESAGIYQDESVSCAAEACRKWMISTSKENIPVGAVLYFNTSVYGHSAIYIGNNRMIHGRETVVEQEITAGYWKLYKGWGWQAGKAPSGAYFETEEVIVNGSPS